MRKKLSFQSKNVVRNNSCPHNANDEARQQKAGWLKYFVMAVCAAGISLIALFVFPGCFRQPNVTASDSLDDSIINTPCENTQAEVSEMRINMNDIHFNQLDSIAAATPKWYDPQHYNEVVWNKADMIDYYGKDLTPAYIPEGLNVVFGSKIVSDKAGNIVMDTIWIGFYHEQSEEDMPKLASDVAARKGLSVTASKIGLLNDCIYLLPDNDIETSNIGETFVTFGYRSMPYYANNTENQELAGSYDLYVAEFVLDGIEYQVVSEQLKAEEIIKVVSSIIYGKKVELI